MDVTWYSNNSNLKSQQAEVLLYWTSFQVENRNPAKQAPLSITLFRIKKSFSIGQMYNSLTVGQLCNVNFGHF